MTKFFKFFVIIFGTKLTFRTEFGTNFDILKCTPTKKNSGKPGHWIFFVKIMEKNVFNHLTLRHLDGFVVCGVMSSDPLELFFFINALFKRTKIAVLLLLQLQVDSSRVHSSMQQSVQAALRDRACRWHRNSARCACNSSSSTCNPNRRVCLPHYRRRKQCRRRLSQSRWPNMVYHHTVIYHGQSMMYCNRIYEQNTVIPLGSQWCTVIGFMSMIPLLSVIILYIGHFRWYLQYAFIFHYRIP